MEIVGKKYDSVSEMLHDTDDPEELAFADSFDTYQKMMATLPVEGIMRCNPLKKYTVNEIAVWYDPQNLWAIGSEVYATYMEMREYLFLKLIGDEEIIPDIAACDKLGEGQVTMSDGSIVIINTKQDISTIPEATKPYYLADDNESVWEGDSHE